MGAIVAILAAALMLTTGPAATASAAASKRAVTAPAYCPVNTSHAGWGVVLVDAQSSAQPNGTNYACTYEHVDTTKPLPQDGVGFAVACPAGSRLVMSGYSFLNRSWRNHRFTDMLAVSDAAGQDVMQFQVAPDGTGYALKIVVRALCRT